MKLLVHSFATTFFDNIFFAFIYILNKQNAGGRGGGQVVSVPTLFSNDLSSNPDEANSCSVKFVFEKNENKQKRPGLAHIFKQAKCSSISSPNCGSFQ